MPIVSRRRTRRGGSRGGFRVGAMGVAIGVAAALVAGACGSPEGSGETAMVDAVADPSASSLDPAGRESVGAEGACTAPTEVGVAELERMASLVDASVFAQAVDPTELQSVGDATRSGEEVHLGRVASVRPVDAELLPMVPLGDGTSGASVAGNTAYWSGVDLEVAHHAGSTTVRLPLAAGGPSVIEAAVGSEALDAFGRITGSCAVVVTGTDGVPAVLGGPRLIAVATSSDSEPVALDPQLRGVVDAAPTLKDLIAGT